MIKILSKQSKVDSSNNKNMLMLARLLALTCLINDDKHAYINIQAHTKFEQKFNNICMPYIIYNELKEIKFDSVSFDINNNNLTC